MNQPREHDQETTLGEAQDEGFALDPGRDSTDPTDEKLAQPATSTAAVAPEATMSDEDQIGLDRTAHRTWNRRSAVMAWGLAILGYAAFSGALAWTLGRLLALMFWSAGWPTTWLHSQVTLAATGLVIIVLGGFVTSPLVRFLGTQTGQRMPKRFRRRYRLRHLKNHQVNVRVWMNIAALLPLGCLFVATVFRQFDADWRPMGWYVEAGGITIPIQGWLGTVGCLALGVTVRLRGADWYRRSQRSEIRRGLRHHRRGVSLRSFIPAFDSTQRSIYRTCRMSRRLGNAHQAFTWISLGCFSLAGCFAASMQTEYYAAEMGVVISLLAIAWHWPSPHQIVLFSSRVLDPFCRSNDEYVVYE